MQSKTFTGMDKFDLDSQVWRWREEHPNVKIIKQHPDNQLPLEFKPVRPGELIAHLEMLSRQVDYEIINS